MWRGARRRRKARRASGERGRSTRIGCREDAVGEQRGAGNGLGEVGVRAGFEGVLARGAEGVGGDGNDPDGETLGAEMSDRVQPRKDGQAQVHQDEVIDDGEGANDGLVPVRDGVTLPPVGLEHEREEAAGVVVVVHDERATRARPSGGAMRRR